MSGVTLTASVPSSGPTGTRPLLPVDRGARHGLRRQRLDSDLAAERRTFSGSLRATVTEPVGTYWFCAHYVGDASFNPADGRTSSTDGHAPPGYVRHLQRHDETAGASFTVTITANKPGGARNGQHVQGPLPDALRAVGQPQPQQHAARVSGPGNVRRRRELRHVCGRGRHGHGDALCRRGRDTLTVSDTHDSNGTVTGQSNQFTVNPGSTVGFALTNPGDQTAGQFFNVGVLAKDNWSNTTADNSTYTVSWSGANNSPNNTAPIYAGTSLSFAAGNAVASGFKFYKATSTTLKMTQGANNYTATFTVHGGSTTGLSLVNPGNQTAGTSFSVTIQNTDTWGNLANDNTTHTITWTGAANAPSGTGPLYGASSVPFSNGQATVSGFTFYNAASTTLKATEGATNVTQTFTVNPGTTSSIALANPGAQVAGAAFSVTITAKDAWQNPQTGTHTITWSGASSSPNGTAPTYGSTSVTFVAGSAAVGGFTMTNAASTTLQATESLVNGSTTFNVTAGAAKLFKFTNCTFLGGANQNPCPASFTGMAGGNKTATLHVTVYDTDGNLKTVTGSALIVNLSNSSNKYTCPATVTIAVGNSESGVFSVVKTGAGNASTTVATTNAGFTQATINLNN